MRKSYVLLFLLLLAATRGIGQLNQLKESALLEMLKGSNASLSARRIDIACQVMSLHVPTEPRFDSIKNMLTEEVEGSRDRALMCRFYGKVAKVLLNYSLLPELNEKAKYYIDKVSEIAAESNLNEYKVNALLLYAKYYLNISQNQKALDYNNQAISIASAIGSDSLLCVAQDAIANTWGSMSNKISQFQSLLIERDLAEKSGIHGLIQDSYFNLAAFYEGNSEYERAKDFYTQCKDKAANWKDAPEVINCLRGLARCYIGQKNPQLGMSLYNKAIRVADSLGLENSKLKVNLDMLNYYFGASDPEGGFAFFAIHPELMVFIKRFGVEFQLNKLYSLRQVKKGNYDSALYFLRLAEPFEYNPKTSLFEKFNYSFLLADVLENLRRYPEERDVLLHSMAIADTLQDLHARKLAAIELDTVYERMGDYKKAKFYLSEYNTLRDSLENLGKQKDLMNIEIENASQRAEQQKLAQEEQTRTRNNLEYLGITAALASLFIILVVFGVFKISASVIKGLGFFAFIFLFEFIVLLLDNQIHEVTHGEPWKVLGVKVVIIAMLLPMHHWLEEKMLHYLTHKAHTLRGKLAGRHAPPGPAVVEEKKRH